MPVESLEYRQHDLLPTSSGGQWTVLIRRPREALFHPEVAEAGDYQSAIWRARQIVDRMCDHVPAKYASGQSL